MDNTKHPNQASKPALTTQKPKATDKPSPNSPSSSPSSAKTTRGSLTSTSAGDSNANANSDANSVNNQREAWALQHWLQQTPRDEPWRLGSRRA